MNGAGWAKGIGMNGLILGLLLVAIEGINKRKWYKGYMMK